MVTPRRTRFANVLAYRSSSKKRKLAALFTEVEEDAQLHRLGDVSAALRTLKAQASGLSFAMRSLNRRLDACSGDKVQAAQSDVELRAQAHVDQRRAELAELSNQRQALEAKVGRVSRRFRALAYEARVCKRGLLFSLASSPPCRQKPRN